MKKYLVAIAAMFTFGLAHAAIDTSDLTEKQRAELALKAAEMKEEAKTTTTTTVEKAVSVNDAAVDGVKKWTGIGAEVGKGLVVGLAAAAKEANIAVNDFATTPVGKITTAIIVWKLVGKDISSALCGLILLFVGVPVTWKIYRRLIIRNAEYVYEPRLWGLYKARFITSYRRTEDEPYFFLTAGYLIATTLLVCFGIGMIA